MTAIIHGSSEIGYSRTGQKWLLADETDVNHDSGQPIVVIVRYHTGTLAVRVESGDDGCVRSLVHEVPSCRRQPRSTS